MLATCVFLHVNETLCYSNWLIRNVGTTERSIGGLMAGTDILFAVVELINWMWLRNVRKLALCVCSVVFSTQGEEIGLLRGLVVVRTFSYFQKPRMRIQWLSVFQVVSSCFQEMVLRFVLMTKKTLGPLFSFVFLGVLRDMHQVPWRAEVDGEFFRCFACLELVCLLWILDS